MKCVWVIFFSFWCFFGFAQQGKFKVVLDPGHGGKDPGKVQGKVYEKTIVLKIALLVGKELEKDPEFAVTYTRKDDRFIELYERGDIANKENADLFISIHCNSAPIASAKGAETYVLGLHANDINFEVAKEENKVIYLEENYQQRYAAYDINSPESFIGLSIMQEEFLEQSIQIAKTIQNNFTKGLSRRDRGVRQAGFIVLHQTYMPSVLIEAGFLTNEEEKNYLISDNGQKEIASAIVKAIKSYKDWIRGKSASAQVGMTPQEEAPKTSTDQPSALKEEKKIPPKKQEKKEIKEEKPAEKKDKKPEKEKISFKIQLSTSVRDIPLKAENFKGLSPITKEPVKQLYRYYYGQETDFEKAKQLRIKAKEKGYKDAFIVPFVNGNRSTLEQVGLK